MSVAYVTFQMINGTAPVTSGTYTPGAAGNQIFICAFTNGGGDLTFTMSGSASTITVQPVSSVNNLSDGAGDTMSLWGTLSCAGTANQTFTVSQPSGSTIENTYQLEFSGAVSVKSAVYTLTASPGAGAGAILGAAVTVATGDILAAVCFNGGIFDNAPTVNAAGSNNITSYGASVAVYWNGAGSSITPTFTVQGTGSNLTDTYTVVQWVMSATGTAPGTAPFTPYRQTQWFVTDTVIQT